MPRGAYYIMTDISAFQSMFNPAAPAAGTFDVRFTQFLTQKIGVAPVPGSSFYNDPRDGSQQVRFAFCKTLPTLEEASRRLLRLKQR